MVSPYSVLIHIGRPWQSILYDTFPCQATPLAFHHFLICLVLLLHRSSLPKLYFQPLNTRLLVIRLALVRYGSTYVGGIHSGGICAGGVYVRGSTGSGSVGLRLIHLEAAPGRPGISSIDSLCGATLGSTCGSWDWRG